MAERVAFGMEVVRATDNLRSYISVHIEGEWDMELLEALAAFVARQRKRLETKEQLR